MSGAIRALVPPAAAPALGFDQVIALGRAVILLGLAGECLSDHERELLQDAGRRFLEHGVAAPITPAEWQVIEDATRAMNRAAHAELKGGGYLLMLIDGRAP